MFNRIKRWIGIEPERTIEVETEDGVKITVTSCRTVRELEEIAALMAERLKNAGSNAIR
jgi:hypothetical protein